MCTSVSSLRAVSLYTIGNHHSPEGSKPARHRRHPFSVVNPGELSGSEMKAEEGSFPSV